MAGQKTPRLIHSGIHLPASPHTIAHHVHKHCYDDPLMPRPAARVVLARRARQGLPSSSAAPAAGSAAAPTVLGSDDESDGNSDEFDNEDGTYTAATSRSAALAGWWPLLRGKKRSPPGKPPPGLRGGAAPGNSSRTVKRVKRRLADLLAAGKRNNNSLPFQPKTSLGQSVDMSAASSTSRFAELISALPAITEVVSGFRLQAGLAVADLEKKNEREEQEERKEQEEREEQEKREERAEQEAREEQEKREEREEGSENDSGPEDEDKEQHVRESEDEVEVGGGSSEDSESRPKQRDVRAHADFENRLLALDSLKLDAKNTRHLAYLEFEMNLDAIDRLRCLAVRNCMVLLNEDHNASFREASGVVAAGLAGKMAGKASYAARVVRHNLQ